ncbi:hypothetical protein DACRYDRAFT_23936 [Dacryopinax primogenitus]|uniref:BTB domain-containing protein n=1 Tax=Dacryopinax primogenitus (strain DJM 731) TaxID=1858805 RepID=M5G6K0_DACPD|nr:uncharacterized protein DACRYDRAFT_23936 [Dacryopinax primogenitus]EJT99392.1 hypothetical protein DACRYDRAFT_23936 [Dacryopinax primogenitus]
MKLDHAENGGGSVGGEGQKPAEEGVHRHPKWYFSDGSIVLRIENTLYNLHQSFLSCSSVFRGMFALPPSAEQEGGSDENPVVLSEDRAEFDVLLEFLYPSLDFSISSYAMDTLCMLLRLADKYDFADIRMHVVHQLLAPVNPHNLSWQRSLDLGTRHGTPQLVVAGSVGICLQSTPLDVEDLRVIAYAFPEDDRVAALLHARDKARDHLYTKAFADHHSQVCTSECRSLQRISQHLRVVLRDPAVCGGEKTFPGAVKKLFLRRDTQGMMGPSLWNCSKCVEQADALVERVLNTAAMRELVQEVMPWCRSIKPLPRGQGVLVL